MLPNTIVDESPPNIPSHNSVMQTADPDGHYLSTSANETCTGGCTVFTFFNKLPPELRLKIWRLEFLRGRKVEVGVIRFEDDGPATGHSWTPNPVTLSVNRESRAETLKHYKGRFTGRSQRVHYFHSDVDTVFLKQMPFNEETLEKINPRAVKVLELYNVVSRNGGVVLWPWSSDISGSYMTASFFAGTFHYLEHLILVPGPHSLEDASNLFSTPSVLKAAYAYALGAFVWEKRDNPEYTIPKITIQGYPQVEAMVKGGETTI